MAEILAIFKMIMEFMPLIMECIDKPDDPEPQIRLREFAERFTKMAYKNGDHWAFGLGSSMVCLSHQSDERFHANCQGMLGMIQSITPEPEPIIPTVPK